MLLTVRWAPSNHFINRGLQIYVLKNIYFEVFKFISKNTSFWLIVIIKSKMEGAHDMKAVGLFTLSKQLKKKHFWYDYQIEGIKLYDILQIGRKLHRFRATILSPVAWHKNRGAEISEARQSFHPTKRFQCQQHSYIFWFVTSPHVGLWQFSVHQPNVTWYMLTSIKWILKDKSPSEW